MMLESGKLLSCSTALDIVWKVLILHVSVLDKFEIDIFSLYFFSLRSRLGMTPSPLRSQFGGVEDDSESTCKGT